MARLCRCKWCRKRSGRITTGADKTYDTRDFVDTVRELGVTPHVARRQHGAIDERTSRHPGYAISLSKRWLVEKPFGWLKQIGPLKKVKLRGLAKMDWLFEPRKRLPGMLYGQTGESPTSLLGRYWTVWDRRALLRMEDKIRRLCSELLARRDDEEVGPILVELRHALHQHIERLRERFGAYPLLVERRARSEVPPVHQQGREDTAKKTPRDGLA